MTASVCITILFVDQNVHIVEVPAIVSFAGKAYVLAKE